MHTLEYTGLPNVTESPDTLKAFVDRVIRKYPKLTLTQINKVVYRAVVERQARFKIGKASLVFVLFGRDILSNDLLSNPAWQYMDQGTVKKILTESVEARLRRCTVPDLSQTYIWCWQNAWLQTMPDEDFDRIQATPARLYFKEPEIHGLHVEVRAYDYEMERIPVNSLEEGNRVMADRKPKNYVQGADIRAD